MSPAHHSSEQSSGIALQSAFIRYSDCEMWIPLKKPHLEPAYPHCRPRKRRVSRRFLGVFQRNQMYMCDPLFRRIPLFARYSPLVLTSPIAESISETVCLCPPRKLTPRVESNQTIVHTPSHPKRAVIMEQKRAVRSCPGWVLA